ncbi:hypothetical protein [Streptococcus suis]|uniref:hypothetical protein n=1 Tax=Streptococcus suis TaxID=1307 RepID=UPI00147806F5
MSKNNILFFGQPDAGGEKVSKLESKFEKYVENLVDRQMKSGNKHFKKWFIRVKIEE